jgi:PTS system nitrogen regulatory IIA component
MKITDYLSLENIFLDVALPDKTSVLRFIAESCVKNNIVKDARAVLNGLEKREKTMSTGVGGGLAFPHTISVEAQDAAVLLIRPVHPVDFESLDEKPIDIVLALIIPQSKPELHVRLLARISRLCREPAFVASVRKTADPPLLWREMQQAEQQAGSY